MHIYQINQIEGSNAVSMILLRDKENDFNIFSVEKLKTILEPTEMQISHGSDETKNLLITVPQSLVYQAVCLLEKEGANIDEREKTTAHSLSNPDSKN